MRVSVIVPTHNPHHERLVRTLQALHAQTFPCDAWEIVLVDNASAPAVALSDLPPSDIAMRVVREPNLGLTSARRSGIAAARGELLIFVDDDNLLAPDYLARAATHFEAHPQLGALGGKSLPEFEQPPPKWWQPEFDGLIACRDLGDASLFAADRRDPQNGFRLYPHCAPLGAGMAVRRRAIQTWLDTPKSVLTSDRRGNELTSGGDNDISLTLLRAGWQVAYFPDLVLTHLIPAARVQRDYVARLNRAIAKSWIHILHQHEANPWPPIAPSSVSLRQLKAWFAYRAWTGPAQYIRWQGACGHFEARASLPLTP